METPKPMQGTWTLTAPDGRTWQADSPLRCAANELRERVPAEVAMQRIREAAATCADCEHPTLCTDFPDQHRSCDGSWLALDLAIQALESAVIDASVWFSCCR